MDAWIGTTSNLIQEINFSLSGKWKIKICPFSIRFSELINLQLLGDTSSIQTYTKGWMKTHGKVKSVSVGKIPKEKIKTL